MPPDELLEPLALSMSAHVLAFVLGTLFGSFANVCIYRWPPTDEHPRGQSVVRPGSHCGACRMPVRWYDNVPILSYLLLRGRCRDCGASFSARYLLVEAVMGVLFVAVYHFAMVAAYPLEPLSLRVLRFLILAAFAFVLVVISFIDLDHKLILDKITYPAIPIFYALGLLLPERHYSDGLIGAVVGYGVVRLISDGYYYLTGREGLGLGDGKLLAIIGALLGWQAVVVALFAGSVLGSLIGITAIVLAGRGERSGLPAGEGSEDGAARAGEEPAEGGREALEGDGAARAGEEPAEGVDGGEAATEDPAAVPLRHVQLPFGPFLAMGAVAYLFAEPWLRIDFVGL